MLAASTSTVDCYFASPEISDLKSKSFLGDRLSCWLSLARQPLEPQRLDAQCMAFADRQGPARLRPGV